MSLEEALAKNTAALVALTEALATAGVAKPTEAVAPKATPRPTAPATPAPAAGKPAAAKAPAPAAKPVAKAAPTPAAPDQYADYLPVKAKILELGAIPATGRAAVTEVLSQFGVTKGPDLTPDQYEEAKELLQTKIDELSEQA